mgnify:FL=1
MSNLSLNFIVGVLHNYIPLFFLLSLLLVFFLVFLNRKTLKDFFLKKKKKTWLILFFIFISAFLVRIFISPHQHFLYIDEPWYMNAATNIIEKGVQGDYYKSIGWPSILAVAFSLFGASNWVAIYVSVFIGALTVFPMFFLTWLMTKSKNLAFTASFLLTLFPAHIRWSGAVETNLISLFFILCSFFLCFLYYKKQDIYLLWLVLMFFSLTVQIRPENYFLPFFFVFGFLLFKKKKNHLLKIFNWKALIPWFMLFFLSFANLIQVLNFQTSTNWANKESELINGSNWCFNNLIFNSVHFGRFLFNGTIQPVLISIFLVIGLFFLFVKNKKLFLFLSSWFLFLYLVYFFSWPSLFRNLFKASRMFVVFYPIIAIFSAYGILKVSKFIKNKFNISFGISKIFFIILFVLILFFIPYVLNSSKIATSDYLQLETIVPEKAEDEISEDYTIISAQKLPLESTTNFNVIMLKNFLNDEKQREKIIKNNSVLFYEDMFCKVSFWGAKDYCAKIKDKYKLEKFKTYQFNNIEYVFYKIKM